MESRPVVLDDMPVGVAIRPASGSLRPLFVSPGSGIDLVSAERIVRAVLAGKRLPLPVYWADRLSRQHARIRDDAANAELSRIGVVSRHFGNYCSEVTLSTKDSHGTDSDRQPEGPLEIAITGDLTDNQTDLCDKLLSVEPGGECMLYFDSPGGSPYCGMALTSLIVLRGLRATGIVAGECSSAALWPFAACSRRLVTAYSVCLFHHMKWQSEENVGLVEAAEWARHFGILEQDMDALLGRLFGVTPRRSRSGHTPAATSAALSWQRPAWPNWWRCGRLSLHRAADDHANPKRKRGSLTLCHCSTSPARRWRANSRFACRWPSPARRLPRRCGRWI